MLRLFNIFDEVLIMSFVSCVSDKNTGTTEEFGVWEDLTHTHTVCTHQTQKRPVRVILTVY